MNEDFKKYVADIKPLEQDKVLLNKKKPKSPAFGLKDFTSDSSTVFDNTKGMSLRHENGLWLNFEISANQKKALAKSPFHAQATIDLHGMTTDTASKALARFLNDCHGNQLKSLTIVHGKGTGLLRALCKDYLKGNRLVLAYTDDRNGGATHLLLRAVRKS